MKVRGRSSRAQHLLGVALCVLATIFALPAHAQAYPSKPVRMIVNFPPGGSVDIVGRAIADKLSAALGQPVVVENRGGANGNIGGEAVAKAAPDGYTLLMTSGGMLSTSPHLYATMPFDPLKDFDLITQAVRVPVVLVVRADLPVNTAQEFLAHLKANPGKLTYATPGNGSSPHIATKMLESQAGVSANHVPYKGMGLAVQDILSGRIDFVFDPGVLGPHIKSGKVKLLAVGSPKRLSGYPDTPTLAEIGVTGFDGDSAHAIIAPAGLPREVAARLNREIVQVLRAPDFAERMRAMGLEVIGNTPEEFAANLRADHARLGRLIKGMNIRAD